MTDRGSADPTVPSNKPDTISSPSSAMSSPSGPDGQYSKAVKKGDIRVKPKLGADNYLTWAEEMWIQLKSMRVLKLIEGTISQLDPIRANCEKTQITHLWNKKTSKAAWDALKKVHGVYVKGRINHLLKRFYTYKARPSDTIDDILGALKTLRIQIADIKAEYEPHDGLMAVALLTAVEDSAYDTIKELLERDSELSLEVAKEALKTTEQKLRIKKEDSAVEDAHRANASKKRKGPPPKCDHCGKLGHIQIYCWTWLDTTNEGKEWERTHPEQKRKSKSSKSNTASATPDTPNASKPTCKGPIYS
ncbi:hypothetical protein MMC07_007786 [Pseudocyphellaria aurata]|nr:hypothetical protein [Pseudocyphellaria aurata]